jgi:hypothetical protein
MSLFDQASILITPNAVKEGKLFSIKPTDGSGDLSVVRATTATEVDSNGLIQDVPYNLVQYSEQFNNAVWLKLNSSISANTTTSPIGTLTADKLIENNITDIHQCFYNGITAGSRIIGNFVFTVYAKKLDSNRNIPKSAYPLIGLLIIIGIGIISFFLVKQKKNVNNNDYIEKGIRAEDMTIVE